MPDVFVEHMLPVIKDVAVAGFHLRSVCGTMSESHFPFPWVLISHGVSFAAN